MKVTQVFPTSRAGSRLIKRRYENEDTHHHSNNPLVLRCAEINFDYDTNRAFEPMLLELTGWTAISKVAILAIENGNPRKFRVHFLLNGSHRQRNHCAISLVELRELFGRKLLAFIEDDSF